MGINQDLKKFHKNTKFFEHTKNDFLVEQNNFLLKKIILLYDTVFFFQIWQYIEKLCQNNDTKSRRFGCFIFNEETNLNFLTYSFLKYKFFQFCFLKYKYRRAKIKKNDYCKENLIFSQKTLVNLKNLVHNKLFLTNDFPKITQKEFTFKIKRIEKIFRFLNKFYDTTNLKKIKFFEKQITNFLTEVDKLFFEIYKYLILRKLIVIFCLNLNYNHYYQLLLLEFLFNLDEEILFLIQKLVSYQKNFSEIKKKKYNRKNF